jgi:reticulon-3
MDQATAGGGSLVGETGTVSLSHTHQSALNQ